MHKYMLQQGEFGALMCCLLCLRIYKVNKAKFKGCLLSKYERATPCSMLADIINDCNAVYLDKA